MSFLKFMANPIGRGARIVAGVAIAFVGLLVVGGVLGIGLAVVGAIVFLAGAINFCGIAPLVGGPLSGRGLNQA